MPDEMGIFEAMHTQRAIRRLKPDPVPDELVRKILNAGIRAPNGGNNQVWNFVVIKDPELRRKIGDMYRKAGSPFQGTPTSPQMRKTREASAHLQEHFHEAPVLILACVRHDGAPGDISRGGSIYPAVQNMLLAARALGLGSLITNRQRRSFEKEIKELLGIPENVDTAALLPLGYPAEGEHYGPTTRKPIEEVAFLDRWGANL